MWKAGLLLLVLGVAGFLVYHFLRADPEQSACERIVEKCGFDRERAKQCEQALDRVKQMVGEEAVKKIDECTRKSKTCPDASGCVVGGMFQEGANEFLKGLDRALQR